MKNWFVAAAAATAIATVAPTSSAQGPTTWKIDVTHSELTFRIRHFVSKVRGQFNRWEGNITSSSDKSFDGGSVDIAIDATSIDTNNERRDNDLRSANFFEVEKYPGIAFKSTNAEVAGNDITITGELTLKGVTKPVVLKGSYNGVTTSDARGTVRAGFEASTKLNRLDWGVSWNRAVEGGGAMLGDEVEITVAIEAIKVVPKTTP
jgi:polyisoprenoid-binding protein YceI